MTEELESGRVINCNELKPNKNQDHVKSFFIPKFSKKDFFLSFTKTLEVSTVINLMNYPFPYLQIPCQTQKTNSDTTCKFDTETAIQLHFPSHENKTGSRITIKQCSGNMYT